jgi:DNA-binding NarL/FixJ family response regulator
LALTRREKEILRLSKLGYSDYRIARKLRTHPPTVMRSHMHALRKIHEAEADLEFARKLDVKTQPKKKSKWFC